MSKCNANNTYRHPFSTDDSKGIRNVSENVGRYSNYQTSWKKLFFLHICDKSGGQYFAYRYQIFPLRRYVPWNFFAGFQSFIHRLITIKHIKSFQKLAFVASHSRYSMNRFILLLFVMRRKTITSSGPSCNYTAFTQWKKLKKVLQTKFKQQNRWLPADMIGTVPCPSLFLSSIFAVSYLDKHFTNLPRNVWLGQYLARTNVTKPFRDMRH